MKTVRKNKYIFNKTIKQHKYTKIKKSIKKNGRFMKKLSCSPKEKGKKNNFSCYTDESLYKLRDLWNARHPDALIKSNDTKEIHSELANYLKNTCRLFI